MRHLAIIVSVVITGIAGCGTATADQHDVAASPEATAQAQDGPACNTDGPACGQDENVGEGEYMLTRRDICVSAVLYGAGLGCAAATLACGTSTAITVGGMILPCVYVIAGACAVLPAGAGVYAATLCEGR